MGFDLVFHWERKSFIVLFFNVSQIKTIHCVCVRVCVCVLSVCVCTHTHRVYMWSAWGTPCFQSTADQVDLKLSYKGQIQKTTALSVGLPLERTFFSPLP